MRLEPTEIDGVFVAHTQLVADGRGTFTRTFSAELFAEHGLDPTVAQCSLSTNRAAATLRGMHLQRAPHGETKFVRCTRGRVYDVAVDARPDSPGFGRWFGVELDPQARLGLVIPPGVAHGFVTLIADSELTYQISAPYHPEASVGFRWDDPAVGIAWPCEPQVMSDRDRYLPPLARLTAG